MVDLISEILHRIKITEKELIEAIASGVNVHSYDGYQKLVGKREGLSETLSIIEQILSEDEDDL